MRMLSDVRDFVGNLPFTVVEKQADYCVYFGIGQVNTGSVKFPTTVKIVRNEHGKLAVVVDAPKAGVRKEISFDTEDQRKKAPDLVQALMSKYLN